jgi:hypothetical protein
MTACKKSRNAAGSTELLTAPPGRQAIDQPVVFQRGRALPGGLPVCEHAPGKVIRNGRLEFPLAGESPHPSGLRRMFSRRGNALACCRALLCCMTIRLMGVAKELVTARG